MIKKIYTGLRSALPPQAQVMASKMIFRLMNKPIYDSANNPGLKKAAVVISADFELAWAWRFAKRPYDAIAMGRQERENFPVVLNILNERNIPITWATVGHLFLDSCERKNGRAHDDICRPPYFENEYWQYTSGDWYDIDPCSNYKSNPEFYAPDLIEMIQKSDVPHEIGCHSFSHCDFNDSNSTPELIRDELSACREAMKRAGVVPESFVFPGNQYGSFDMLKEFGYSVIRYKTNDFKEIGFPEKLPNGLTAIHDSFILEKSEEGWSAADLLWKIRRYIDRAVEHNAICHLWFHPSIPAEDIEHQFIPAMDYIVKLRDAGKLDILRMKDMRRLPV